MRNVGDHYEYDDRVLPIGQGAFSKVYLGRNKKDGSQVAIKVIELPQIQGKSKTLLREIEIMRHLKHDNIVHLYDVQYEKMVRNGCGVRLFIVMEYCERGDFSSLARPIEEEKCRVYFREIVSGLYYLYKRGIVHRDIKPQNILLTADNHVKLADFTFARNIGKQELMQTMCGTPMYIAPEIMNGDQYDGKCDIWSLGVMLYQSLYGSHPLGSIKSHADLARKLRSVKITFPRKLVLETYEPGEDHGRHSNTLGTSTILCRTVHHFSEEVTHLVRSLLCHNPNDRISWDLLCKDKWLQIPEMTNQDVLFNQDGDFARPTHAFSAPTTLALTDNLGSATPSKYFPPPPREIMNRPRPISKKIPAVTPPSSGGNSVASDTVDLTRRPTRVTTSAASPFLGEDDGSWGFKMSDDVPEPSRIIHDYSPTSNQVIIPLKQEKTSSSSFIARSMESLHKIFT